MDDYYDNNDFDVNEFNRLFKETQDKKEEKENVEKLEYLKSLSILFTISKFFCVLKYTPISLKDAYDLNIFL